MKKIFSYTALLLSGIFALTSCEKDVEWNPTLTQPTSFVLNNPVVGEGLVDLANSTGLDLAWSQPVYTTMNAPIVSTYSVEVSPSGAFNKGFDALAEDNTGADYFVLDETTTSCNTSIKSDAIAKGLQQVCNYVQGQTPNIQQISLRVKSAVKDAASKEHFPIYSNVVTANVKPYYIELSDADPNWWYLIGGDIADGKWGDDIPTSLFPLQPQKDYEFDKKTGDGVLVWTGYIAGNGFKLKKAPGDWDHQWGQGTAFGEFVENDGGSGNISVPSAGYYTVTLKTDSHKLSVDAAATPANVYQTICVLGSFDSWGAGLPMNPVHTAAGVNHDWYITMSLDANAELKFNIGNWDTNWGAAPVRKLSDGMYGFGTQNGANIVVPEAGNYLIIFNDITGYYRLIKK